VSTRDSNDMRTRGPLEHTLAILELPKVFDAIAAHASTTCGADRVRARRPLASLDALRREAARVREATCLLDADGFSVGRFADPRADFARAAVAGSVLDPAAFVAILELLRSIETTRRRLRGHEDLPLLARESGSLTPRPELAARLARTFDADGRVLDSASPRLGRIRREAEETRDTIRRQIEKKLAALAAEGALQESLITLRGGRYVLPVKAAEKGRVPGVVHDESASGATLFVEPLTLVPLNNRMAELAQEESREIRAILAECTADLRATLGTLERDVETLADLDDLIARARYGRAVGGVLPSWSERGELRLVGARHPLLLERLGDRVVPLDLEMSAGASTLLLSGPNTGGKTVALKTIGLLSLLAQCGAPIPAADGTTLPIFTEHFADVGDEQSIEESLSTFSSRLRRLREVLDGAGAGSLVLLDEIGTGTDPEEGGALAGAILRALARRGARTIATTHLGFLMDLAANEEGMANASMEFDAANVRPTYQILPGVPGKSHALEVARGLGLDAAVLADARALLPEGARRSRELLAELTERIVCARAVEQEAADHERRAAECEREWTERRDALVRDERDLRRRAAADARALYARAEQEADEAVSALRALRRAAPAERGAQSPAASGANGAAGVNAAASAIEAARAQAKRLNASRHAAEREAELSPVELPGRPPERVEPGEPVLVGPFGRRGKVIGPTDAAGKVEVLVGSVRMTLPLGSLRTVGAAGDDDRREDAARGVTLPPAREVGFELDLRGLRADEAVALVDRHIDAAVVARLRSVRIIHGLGTGALRREIGAFLERDERVKSSRKGESGEGDLGVTVVELH